MDILLQTEIQYLKGVGPKLAEKLHRLGIGCVSDLIFHWPRRYEDYTQISKIADLGIGNFQLPNPNYRTIRARIVGIGNKVTARRHMKITEAVAEDGTGSIKLVWFNQPYLKDYLKPGKEFIFHGKVSHDSFNHILVMESPTRSYEPKIVPIYPETAGISSGYINKLISNLKSPISQLEDFLPSEIVGKYNLIDLRQAVVRMHFPENQEAISDARKRLAFDELFLMSLRSRLAQSEINKLSLPVRSNEKELDLFIKSLPFELTNDQEKATKDIVLDLGKTTAMNRLLNGDVGSGKTAVAVIAAYTAVKSGYRVVVMVPTEVLASQHYNSFVKLFEKHGVSVGLMTSSQKKFSKSVNQQISKLAPVQADIVIGTQALLQKGVELENVGLVIVDEQHRFGVKQRAALIQMRYSSQSPTSLFPHFLSMTATPIPRTMHLALFGDLDVSVILEKPKNRKEIKTRFVESFNRQKAYDFIRLQIKAGRQVFVICPLIEDSDSINELTDSGLWDQDKKSVMKEYERLQKEIFPEFQVAMLHGKMKSKEKEAIMADFAERKSDILVSTSVIEVGIDVPNATVMMIEDAERFGLAQIHQFRGRVGRGEHQSFCFLFSGTRNPMALSRLKNLEAVSDGFKLAEIDLDTRGPGDILGTMQSGLQELKLASFSDKILLSCAGEAAKSVIDNGIDRYPALKDRLNQFEMTKHFE